MTKAELLIICMLALLVITHSFSSINCKPEEESLSQMMGWD